jgi:hypothetical protein
MGFKEANFTDRQKAAAEAKKALLDKFRATAGNLDATFDERQEALKAARLGREARAAEREAVRLAREAEVAEKAAREREAVEAAAREAAEKAAQARREEADRLVALEAEQKAARDARYAARKKRKK